MRQITEIQLVNAPTITNNKPEDWKITQYGVEHTSAHGRMTVLIPWAQVKEIWFYNSSPMEDLKNLANRGVVDHYSQDPASKLGDNSDG